MNINAKVKQIFCKHDYKPWANIGNTKVDNYNTVLLCTKCYKRKYIKEYIKSPYSFDDVIYLLNLLKYGIDNSENLENSHKK